MVDKSESTLSRLAREAVIIESEWYGDSGTDRSLAFHALALNGDVGRLAGIVHQIEVGNKDPRLPATRMELAMTVTEAFHNLLVTAGLVGVDLEQALLHWRGQVNGRRSVQRVGREMHTNGN